MARSGPLARRRTCTAARRQTFRKTAQAKFKVTNCTKCKESCGESQRANPTSLTGRAIACTSRTQGYKSWSQRAFINLRADKLWDVVNQSIDSLVADYRSTLVIAHPTAVQVADKVAEYRERAIRRNDLACKYIANSTSELRGSENRSWQS
ncbi:BZ3500_MvSof-1268-A1-R1_Chr10-1g02568 [Microbotryum saponariae]|uniref:BZ3500_MvSof-1268-A1-R1_Chr10-1g02568 protein n=1 Tax=Microbotryum saponariae TaxID=289078 RepID=A0A2X0L8E9_9BASI|nr:BZ3500_MvSof-1268-A1-R1_Chr10-1g02568 [Microbotryum saponariae]SDA06057.1 BZ3501_MvSof-1269-A2-R1_Chr10-1g02169 [Microbotryum saponariae]